MKHWHSIGETTSPFSLKCSISTINMPPSRRALQRNFCRIYTITKSSYIFFRKRLQKCCFPRRKKGQLVVSTINMPPSRRALQRNFCRIYMITKSSYIFFRKRHQFPKKHLQKCCFPRRKKGQLVVMAIHFPFSPEASLFSTTGRSMTRRCPPLKDQKLFQ